MPPKSNNYSAKNIQSLTPREHIRLRPGMYMGGTDSRALHHMIYEVLDNATEEVMLGKCNRITVTLQSNQTVTIEDNSEGLPVEKILHPFRETLHANSEVVEKSHLEFIMTNFVHKTKFDDNYYGVSGGLHGVGLTAVNTLSKNCTVQVRREGFLWEQSYEEGLPTTKVRRVRELRDDEETGNSITFQPDFTIIDKNDFDFQIVATRCKDIAYLFPDATISLRDLRGEYLIEEIYHTPNGFIDWLSELNDVSDIIHLPLQARHIVQLADKQNRDYQVGVTMAFQFTKTPQTIEKSFINTVPISDGGVHIRAFKSALVEVINAKANMNLSWKDIKAGLTCVFHIQHPTPQFESPTKTKLMNPEVGIAVKETLQQAIDTQLQAFDMLLQYLATH